MENKTMKALIDFAASAQKLTEAWDDDNYDLSVDYPFAKSFDEQVVEIKRWRDSSILEIKEMMLLTESKELREITTFLHQKKIGYKVDVNTNKLIVDL